MAIKMDKTFPRQNETASSRFIEILLAVLFPPVAILLNRGPGKEFVIAIVLTILGYLPGVVYTLFVIFSDVRIEGGVDSEDGFNSENKNDRIL